MNANAKIKYCNESMRPTPVPKQTVCPVQYSDQCRMGREKLLTNIFIHLIIFRTRTTARSAWKKCLNTTPSGSTLAATDSTTIASM